MDFPPPIPMAPPPAGRSAEKGLSHSTISKDATQGYAAEEMQILSHLADRTRDSQKLGKEDNHPQFIPPQQAIRRSSIPGGMPQPPPQIAAGPPPPIPGKDPEDDDDSDNEGLDIRLQSAPFLSGTRLHYQASAVQDNVAPTLPLDWKPTWSFPPGAEPQQQTNGLHPEVDISQQMGHKSCIDPNAGGVAMGNTAQVNGAQNGNQNVSSASGLTRTLAQTVQATLQHDLLGKSNQSALFSFLLDSIEKLEWMNIALNEKLAKRPTEPIQIPQPDTQTIETAISMQTVHQIYCTNFAHGHWGALYADEPTFRESQSRTSTRKKRLEGLERISDVEGYLKSKPKIAFVVYKIHICEGQHDAARGWSMQCSCRSCVQNDLMKQHASLASHTEVLRIISPQLKKTLRELGKCRMDGFIGGQEGDPHMTAPYLFLYHHRAEIAKKLEEDSEEAEHLRLLSEWLDANHGKDYKEADDLFARGLVSEPHLTKLFKPNQVIVKKEDKGDIAAYAAHWWPCWKDSQLTMQVWSWNFDGFDLTRKAKQLSQTYNTHKDIPITDLKAYPIEYAPKELLDTLLVRGKKFWSMRNGHFASYTGLDSLREENYHGNRFMIDIKTYARMHPNSGNSKRPPQWGPFPCTISDSAEFDTWPIEIPASDTLKDEVAMLLPYEVPGFEMESKKWVKLNIMQIERVAWNKKAFNRLVLEQQNKELIRALVSVHLGNRTTGDIIAGKGNGLIILLHGSPGVGKTLTAESVAELAEKPLYRVTCGDIGNKPDEVEKYLRMVLYLGKIWDCVLLMDEADVFLEERTMADLQRNSLVSVFLRILESYGGILILTSNRVGTFDEAFKSRIQVALHYKPLNRKSRKQIWHNFFEMIREEDDDVDVDEFESRLDELAAEEMNGRQIRNCLQTAQQLSKFKKEPLSWNSLSQALQTALDFQRYLKNIHGHNDETWAREERLR